MLQIVQHGVEGGNAVTRKRVTFSYSRTDDTVTVRRYEGPEDAEVLVVQSTWQYEEMTGALGGSSLAIAGISHVDAQGNVLASHDYTHDSEGLIDSYTNSTDGLAQYDYDAEGQLVAADHESQSDESFAYDANGNRLEYQVGPNNQVLCDGYFWYEYDNEGRRTEKYQWTDTNSNGLVDLDERSELTSYTWDVRGRLVKITTRPDGQESSQIVKYEYDYQNRRNNKKIETFDTEGHKVSTVEHSTYLGADIVIQTGGDGDLTHRYLHATAPGSAVVDDTCLADERIIGYHTENETLAVLWLLSDNLGTVRDIAVYDAEDCTTEIVAHFSYASFGALTEATGEITTIYGFTGRETDPESGLMHYRARYYDVYLGAFTSEDPLSFAAGDFNLYRYVGNSPVNYNDPSGMEGLSFGQWLWAGLEGAAAFHSNGPRTGKNLVIGGCKGVKEMYLYGHDIEYVTYDMVGTFFGHPIGYKEMSSVGISNQPSDPDFAKNTFVNAGEAGLAGLTCGGERGNKRWICWYYARCRRWAADDWRPCLYESGCCRTDNVFPACRSRRRRHT